MRSRALVGSLAIIAACAAGACSTRGGARVANVIAGSPAAAVPVQAVPSSVMGLRATPVDVEAQFAQAKDRAFVTAIRMWSLRDGARLRATVEVARFALDARPGDRDFQQSMVDQLGSVAPRLRTVDEQLVYVTPGNSQTLFAWFRGVDLMILSVSIDYPEPRALLRAMIAAVKV